MAIYENLPVYKQSYDLLLEIYGMSKNMSRDYRYTIGEELKKRIMDLMVCIYHANGSTNEGKGVHLKQAREYIVEIKLYIRLLADLKQISVKRLADLTEKTESVSKQLSAWEKSVRKTDEKKPDSTG
ncbi:MULTISPECIES: four helix bundle protein [unclassified Dysgonomonas]|uniref:four helix bundle protein n=1 Tax=unclassified Dysgonomonas TaxID=2630389 RepID=UPI0006824C3E|nr:MULTISPECIES: four helix bundle protein [unclassified Dysgonomonas]MBD8347736.1 four helix bundle protein [Dysgonomonas sp. HGC4]MBF0647880.1 four helix bundle protein [Dysgonomonas sp. GY75]